MVGGRTEVLERLEAEPRKELRAQATKWLLDDDTMPVSALATCATVAEVSRVWRIRQKISRSKGQTITGADQLLVRPQALPLQTKLEQRPFPGSSENGNIFFEKTTGRYVGLIMTQHADIASELLCAS